MTTGRTFAIGDIHGDLDSLLTLMGRLPELKASDTLVFVGDYVDGGPDSAGVVRYLRRELPKLVPARQIHLRGNHEDAWVRVLREGFPGFVLPEGNGCRATVHSFLAAQGRDPQELSAEEEFEALFTGKFFPLDVVSWMRALPYWYEDEHAIYVHAGLPEVEGGFGHPSLAKDPHVLLWSRSKRFYTEYTGKAVVCGHTLTRSLPPELSQYTPDDPDDLYWSGGSLYLIDTGCGKGGFLTALELPSGAVYESR